MPNAGYHFAAGTLYVFLMVCSGVLYMRYHQPGSGSSALPILAALGGLVLTAIGEPRQPGGVCLFA